MTDVGVDYYAVSSTSMCEENYAKVLSELRKLINLDDGKVLPVMWITPSSLKGNIAWLLESEIKWRCIKIHPFLNQKEWKPNGELIIEVIDIARELELPVLIHTGNEQCCQCGIYYSLIAKNPDVRFILAHGRPLDQVIPILKNLENVYADSAFMPIGDMKRLMDERLSHKLLWGTDMCIPQYYYPKENMVKYYQRKLESFRCVSTSSEYEQVTFHNAATLFGLQQLK